MAKALQKLDQLATEINSEHERCATSFQEGVLHAVKAGALLVEAKGHVARGDWGDWVYRHCSFSARTAQGYMRVARHHNQLEGENAQRVAHLSLRETLKLLRAPKPSSPENPQDATIRFLDDLIYFGEVFQDNVEILDYVRDSGQWKDEAATFEEYCLTRWRLSLKKIESCRELVEGSLSALQVARHEEGLQVTGGTQ